MKLAPPERCNAREAPESFGKYAAYAGRRDQSDSLSAGPKKYLAPMSSLDIRVTERPDLTSDDRLAEILANPGFGVHMTDHMLTVEWTPDQGWHDARIGAYGPLTLDPASAVLHYAQEIFEGMKAYRHDDGSVWTFRPEANGERMRHSSRRLALPELPVEDFVATVDALVEVDQRWVPESTGEKSLYLRPFMFASEKFLGVRPAKHVTFMAVSYTHLTLPTN